MAMDNELDYVTQKVNGCTIYLLTFSNFNCLTITQKKNKITLYICAYFLNPENKYLYDVLRYVYKTIYCQAMFFDGLYYNDTINIRFFKILIWSCH